MQIVNDNSSTSTKILPKKEFGSDELDRKECTDLRCQCWEPILLSREETKTQRAQMSCNDFNVIYVVVSSVC